MHHEGQLDFSSTSIIQNCFLWIHMMGIRCFLTRNYHTCRSERSTFGLSTCWSLSAKDAILLVFNKQQVKLHIRGFPLGHYMSICRLHNLCSVSFAPLIWQKADGDALCPKLWHCSGKQSTIPKVFISGSDQQFVPRKFMEVWIFLIWYFMF